MARVTGTLALGSLRRVLAMTLRCGILWVLVFPSLARSGPVLHEPVPVPQLQCAGRICRQATDASAGLPTAVMSDDGLLGAPLGSSVPRDNEQVYSPESQRPKEDGSPLPQTLQPTADASPIRRARALPDAFTGPPPTGLRTYHEVFNPAVFPYKRMTALNAVDAEGALTVLGESPKRLPETGNRLDAGRDPFYGSLVVDLEANKPVPLPTPAAGFRLLSYQTTPALRVRFDTDAAENLFVTAERTGRYRLVYLLDAPQRYFSGPIFPTELRSPVRLAYAGEQAPAPLPAHIQREAEIVLRKLKLRRTATAEYGTVLNQLVSYFRDFAVLPLEPDGSNESLYLRIALSKRGVCRHRSYAFVVTALAIGIPARYIENELHAFVEVHVPSVPGQAGYWRRINLGGAPLEQRVVEAEARAAYHEKGSDPFERPEAFRGEAPPRVQGAPTRGAAAPEGASPSGDGRPTPDPASRTTPDGKAGSGGSSPDGKGQGRAGAPETTASSTDHSADTSRGAKSPRNADDSGSDNPSDGSGDEGSPGTEGTSPQSQQVASSRRDDPQSPVDPRPRAGRLPLADTQVTLHIESSRRLYRGTQLVVLGQATAAGVSPAGMEVTILLAVPAQTLVLGKTVTQADGSYRATLSIPASAPLGTYPIVARLHGDRTRRGSSSGTYRALHESPSTD